MRGKSNQRKDRYGGSLENRLRFPLEVVDAVAKAVGANRLGLRLSPLSAYNDMADSNPKETFYALVEALNPRGLAYVHMIEDDSFGAAKDFDFKNIRRHFNGTWMVNGGYDLARANAAIAAGDADLVSFGAIFLANPDLVERFKKGAPLNEPDPSSFYGGTEKGYIDYPSL